MKTLEPSIERVPLPSREEFERRFVDTNTPVILTGVSEHWPARKIWTPEYFKQVAGDVTVTVHFNEQANFHTWYTNPSQRVDRRIPFGELVDRLVSDPQGDRYYMTEHELNRISPTLVRDVDFSRYVDQGGVYKPLLFLGRDTCMPLHYHGTTEALLSQITGSKEVILFGPDQFSRLYPRPWYARSPLFSDVDGRNPDLERFPKFGRAIPMRFRLEPGETLFIPVQWWHFTRVQGYQVSVTDFWRAKVRNWHFPSPGIQVCAREVLFHSKNALRRVRARVAGALKSA